MVATAPCMESVAHYKLHAQQLQRLRHEFRTDIRSATASSSFISCRKVVHTESADEERQQGCALHFILLIKLEGTSVPVNAIECRNINIGVV